MSLTCYFSVWLQPVLFVIGWQGLLIERVPTMASLGALPSPEIQPKRLDFFEEVTCFNLLAKHLS